MLGVTVKSLGNHVVSPGLRWEISVPQAPWFRPPSIISKLATVSNHDVTAA